MIRPPVDWKRWLIAVGAAIAITAIVIAATDGDSSGPSDTEISEDTPADRAPYAEVACEGFARDAGVAVDDGETVNITATVYTVQLYDDDVRIGTCVVEATGPEEWTLVKLIGR